MMMGIDGDITNRVVRNIFSVEFGIVIIVASMGYGSMVSDVKAVSDKVTDHGISHADDINEIRDDTEDLADDVTVIKSDVEVIKNSQEHFKEALQSTADQQQRLRDGQDLILDQLLKLNAKENRP